MSIEENWLSYEREVLPAGAPPVQVTETRRAFFAGAWAVIQLLRAESPGGGIVLLHQLDDEGRRFRDAVLRGSL